MEQSYKNNSINLNCRAACYCRLSKDDPNDGTSVSIETQKKVLGDYCENNGITVVDYYCDDGFTGTNFDRASFKRMMSDINSGKVNTVIVKDLSRFGREHIMVDYYTQVYFPEANVRFISVLDGTDISRHNVCNYDMPMLIKSVFNEFFPADTSMKVRQACVTKAQHGEYIGSKAPFGYKKSPEDKHVLIVDEETSPIVKRIFEMAAYQGMGFQKIAIRLHSDRVLTPTALESKRKGRIFDGDPYLWNLETVRKIINNPIYIGTLVSGKRRKLSFKSKKIIRTDEAEWLKVENVCEPIISQQLWDDAQLRIVERKVTSTVNHGENIFAGLLKCAECGYSMRISSSAVKRTFFACGGYKKPKSGVQRCTMHYILYDDVYDAVLRDLNAMISLLNSDEKKFRDLVYAKVNADSADSRESVDKETAALEKSIEHSKFKYKQLYEDKLNGLISNEMFREMAAECEAVRVESEKRLEFLTARAARQSSDAKGAEDFLNLIDEYKSVDVLDKELLNKLLEKITVRETYSAEGKKQIRVRIYYKFLGDLDFEA